MASTTFWNPEIAKLQGKYKPATDRVLAWLQRISGHGKDTKVNYYRKLANDAARRGTRMPHDILNDLQDAVNARTEAANWFRTSGAAHAEASHKHEHMIGVLQDILSAFCPSQPTTPRLAYSPGPTPPPLPAFSPTEYFHQPFYPSYDPVNFPAYHPHQDWATFFFTHQKEWNTLFYGSQQDWHIPSYHLQQDWRLPNPEFQRPVQPTPAVPKAYFINNTNWRER